MTGQQILRLGLPVILVNFFEPLVALTDAAIIGNVGASTTNALAATGLGSTILSSIFWLFGNMKSASVSFVSKAQGENRLNEIQGVISHILILSLSIGVLLAIGTQLSFPLLRFYNLDPEVFSLLKIYLSFRSFGLPFMLAGFVLFGIFYGIQKPHFCLFIVLAGGLLNMVLSGFLVYGLKEGDTLADSVQKLAIGSLTSEIFVFCAGLFVLVKNSPLRFNLFSKSEFAEIKKFTVMIFHLFIRSLCIIFVFQSLGFLAAKMGNAETAVQSIMLNLFLMSALMIDGVSSAGLMTSGKLFAQKNYRGLIRMSDKVIQISVNASLIIALVYGIFYFIIIRAFSADPAVHSVFYRTFWLLILLQPISALTYAYDSLFKGLGKMFTLRNVLLISSFGIFPVCLLLAFFFFGNRLEMLWIAFLGWFAGRAFFTRHFCRKYYANLKI